MATTKFSRPRVHSKPGHAPAIAAGRFNVSPQKPVPSLVFDNALLKDFANGKLDPDIEERVAAHLENRPELLAKVIAVSGDGLTKRLKEAKQRSIVAQSRVDPPAKRQQTQAPGTATHNESASQPVEFPGYEIVKERGVVAWAWFTLPRTSKWTGSKF